ncbi:MAG: hypothetical protein WC831_04560 [Parcubacteria group bacterium]|jgi:hypothetical protein
MKKFFILVLSLASLFAVSKGIFAASMDFSENIQTVKTLDELLTSTSGYLNVVAGTIAVVFIIIGASFYAVAAFGKKDMTDLGRKIIIVAVGGFAVVVGAPVIYKEIMNILNGDPSSVAESSSMAKILLRTLEGFAYLVGLYAIMGFLIGGITYFISFGDETRNERAKKILKFTLIGSLIAIGSMVIAKQIVTLLGG